MAKKYKVVRFEMVAVVYAEEFDRVREENLLDEHFEEILGETTGKLPKGKERMVHGVVGVEVKEEKSNDDVLDEYPPYDDGRAFRTLKY